MRVLADMEGDVLSIDGSAKVGLEHLITMLKYQPYSIKYRLFILNADETINREVPAEDIIVGSGSYNENYQNGQRRSVNIGLNNNEGQYNPNINTLWANTKFRLDIGIECKEHGTYWLPRGIYVVHNPSVVRQGGIKTIDLTLADKFAIFEGKAGTLEGTYEIPVGSDIETAIYGILSIDNGMGYPLDTVPIIYDRAFKGAKMPYTLSKDAGSTLGDVLLELGTILNAEVFYNSQGHLCFSSIDEVSVDSQKAVLWTYNYDGSVFLYGDATGDMQQNDYYGLVATYDFDNIINEVQIVGDNIKGKIVAAYAQNTNPASPLCIQRIGRRIEYISDSQIYSDDLAQQRADYELRRLGILRTSVEISVALNPLIFVNNLIRVNDSFYGFDNDNFLVQSISYSLGTDAKMTITCSNIADYSDYEGTVYGDTYK